MNIVFVYRADVPVRGLFERFRGLTNGVNNTAYYHTKFSNQKSIYLMQLFIK